MSTYSNPFVVNNLLVTDKIFKLVPPLLRTSTTNDRIFIFKQITRFLESDEKRSSRVRHDIVDREVKYPRTRSEYYGHLEGEVEKHSCIEGNNAAKENTEFRF